MKHQIISPRAVTSVGPEQRLSMAEARHRELDSRLRQLGRRAFLTPGESMEAAQLKKRKLAAKDEIESLRRRLS
ncbi:YdcH family protein [Sorangium sp. So ce1014]|uniref:YdcH family protein n=1 Tax=unclassified Sorangium TaxID=2621164 RepID=UPI003F624067